MKQVNVAVVGATGYSGEELIRLLIRHPSVALVCVTSRTYSGQTLAGVYPRFAGQRFSELKFVASGVSEIVAAGTQIAFLALPHGAAAEFAKPLLEAGVRVVDLSADFRVRDAAVYQDFYGATHPAPELLREAVYGMPEIYRERIRGARLVASPGCYPTSIILPLHPLLKKGMLEPESIAVSSMSGVSGAGRKAEIDYLFAECNENARAYSVPKHRHLSEIEQELSAAAGEKVTINFTPHLVPITRGILTTIFAAPRDGIGAGMITAAFEEAFGGETFIRLRGEKGSAEIRNVAHTNFLDIAWRHDPRTGRVILLSAEDNLVKGASGQAVQSMNLMSGREEGEGLKTDG